MREGHEDCRSIENAKKATAALLAKLKEHHDYNLALPEAIQIVHATPSAPIAVQQDERNKKQKRIPGSIWVYLINDIKAIGGSEPRVDDIKRAVCEHFNIRGNELVSTRRHARVVLARQIVMYLARRLTRRSYPEIGRMLGDRDHTTVLHGVQSVEKRIGSNPDFAGVVAQIEALCNG